MRETVYELLFETKAGDLELEGVFTSLNEIANYLEIPKDEKPKYTVNCIYNGEIEKLDLKFQHMIIVKNSVEGVSDTKGKKHYVEMMYRAVAADQAKSK